MDDYDLIRVHDAIPLWKKLVVALILAAIAVLAFGAIRVPAQPIVKRGQCPSGWASSAHYCAPPKPGYCTWKVGACPAGTSQSGAYCCTP